VSGQIQYGPGDGPTCLQTPPTALQGRDECHFSTPVRFGRRKTDQVGHLVLTTLSLTFHGTVDVTMSWTGVARADAADRDIVIALQGTRRILRFCCHGHDEATRGAAIANHLAGLAGAERYAAAW
jgi:hypothetical protein